VRDLNEQIFACDLFLVNYDSLFLRIGTYTYFLLIIGMFSDVIIKVIPMLSQSVQFYWSPLEEAAKSISPPIFNLP
jgi:hypothetical protein